MTQISTPLIQRLQQSMATFIAAGVITNIPKQIKIRPTPSKDPLFGVADLFAGVALHHQRYTMDENYSFGQELYTAAKPILDRLPWQPNEEKMVRGIVKL